MKRLSAFIFLAMFVSNLAHGQALPNIRVGWSIPDGEPKFWMLKRPAEFPSIGKDYTVEWQQVQGTAVSAQALAAGALDCATLGALPIAQGVASGSLDLYIMAQYLDEKPGSFSVYWAVKEDSPIKSVADLKGKTVAINVLGSGIHGPFNQVLKRNGLNAEKDIKLVEVGFAVAEDAVRSGRVDAAAFVQPFAGRAEAKGGLRKLFSLSEGVPNIVHLIEVCRKSFVDQNPKLARAYLKDLTSAMGKTLGDRPGTIAVISETLKIPPAVLETFALTPKDFSRPVGAAPDFPAIQAMFDIYLENGQLPKRVDASSMKHPTLTAPVQ